MDTNQIKAELDKNVQKLTMLRDEVKLKLHLASLEAKKEWDEKLSPKLADLEHQTKESMNELVTKVEKFLANLKDKAPHSVH